jgi:hypothetical protein
MHAVHTHVLHSHVVHEQLGSDHCPINARLPRTRAALSMPWLGWSQGVLENITHAEAWAMFQQAVVPSQGGSR